MIDVKIYTSRSCFFCMRAKSLLKAKGLCFNEISIDGNSGLRTEMMQLSGQRTVPQIWFGDFHIGGSDELAAFERSGKLDQLLVEHIEAAKSIEQTELEFKSWGGPRAGAGRKPQGERACVSHATRAPLELPLPPTGPRRPRANFGGIASASVGPLSR